MELSIVTTLYRSAAHIEEFCRRALAAAETVSAQCELVVVNDGSPDDSLDRVRALLAEDGRLRIVDLSRNFGHHTAAMVGLEHARGRRVFLIDCDLEESPEWLEGFWRRMDESGADMVYGVQERRKGSFFERLSGDFYWWLFNRLSAYPVPANSLTVRLMSRRYVDALVRHRERAVFLAGLCALTGFEQTAMPVAKLDRGVSSYDLHRKLALLVRSVTAFTSQPLVYIFYLGGLLFVVSMVGAGWLVIRKIFFGGLLLGWASTLVSLWMLGGLIMLCLGILGAYLSNVLIETKRRPYAIVREVYSADEARNGRIRTGSPAGS